MQNENILSQRSLPNGTILHDTYVVKEVLGEGGFGITYLGYNNETSEHVAIKEYFPSELASRVFCDNQYSLQLFHGKSQEDYQKGQQRFLKEAKHLQELKHLNSIVSIYDSFEEGNTAYIIMEYIEGPTLYQYIKENGPFLFPELLELLTPLMHSLMHIHTNGLIHRDISPDNLILGMDNQLHLIDFGAAKKENILASNRTTIILKSGYAPPEQYLTTEKNGAWMDVYALCATIYFALTGTTPPSAIQRMQKDTLQPLSMTISIQPWQSAAIEKGLQLRPTDRFRDMDGLYHALTKPSLLERTPTISLKKITHKEHLYLRYLKTIRSPFRNISFGIGISVVLALLLAGGIWAWNTENAQETASPSEANASSILPATPVATLTPTPAPTSEPTPNQPKILKMVDVTGLTLKKARKKIKKLDSGIKLKKSRAYDEKVPSNRIVSQNVLKGTLFTQGQISTLELVISRGPEPVIATPSPVPTIKKTKKPSSNKNKTEDDGYATIYRD